MWKWWWQIDESVGTPLQTIDGNQCYARYYENIHTIKTMVSVCVSEAFIPTYKPTLLLSLPTSFDKRWSGWTDRYPSMACLYKFCQPKMKFVECVKRCFG
jgi:hypothetical protein